MSKQFAGPAEKSVCTSQISHCHIQGHCDLKRHLVLILASEPVISQSHQVNVLYRVIILSERYQLPPVFGVSVVLMGLIHLTAHAHGRIVAGGDKCDCPINEGSLKEPLIIVFVSRNSARLYTLVGRVV
jgi:hypothetical protein